MMCKTVVELDLVGYASIARELEEQLDVQTVQRFNDLIQSLVDQGLEAVGTDREHVVKGTAGDNAILVFDDPADAHRFAVAVHGATAARNATKSLESAKWWFRVGVATGALAVDGPKIAGTTIIDAVRLEAAGRKGHVLIDQATYDALPRKLGSGYTGPETVTVKGGEKLQAYRFAVFNVVEAPPNTEIDQVFALFDELKDKSLVLLEVMLRSGMPDEAQPSDALRLGQRISQIVAWATEEQERLDKLASVLRELICRQRS